MLLQRHRFRSSSKPALAVAGIFATCISFQLWPQNYSWNLGTHYVLSFGFGADSMKEHLRHHNTWDITWCSPRLPWAILSLPDWKDLGIFVLWVSWHPRGFMACGLAWSCAAGTGFWLYIRNATLFDPRLAKTSIQHQEMIPSLLVVSESQLDP